MLADSETSMVPETPNLFHTLSIVSTICCLSNSMDVLESKKIKINNFIANSK